MDVLKIPVTLEFPTDIPQQEIWDLEDQLKRIKGVETDLLEPMDLITGVTLILQIITLTAGAATGLTGGAKTVYEVSKTLYNFFRRSDRKQEGDNLKKKIIIVKKGKRLEIDNLSIEDIERIIKEQ